MQFSAPESVAHIIAENVASAFEHECDGDSFDDRVREIIVARLVRNLLSAMPTRSSNVLTAACNRALDDTVGETGFIGPRVENIDLEDGSVTMRWR